MLVFVKITFDKMENKLGQARQHEIVAGFEGDEKLTAHGKAAKWLAEQPPMRRELGWDGEVYPQFELRELPEVDI